MRICKKCNLKIKTDSDICPLCQNKLIGKKEDNIFPNIPNIYRKYFTLFKMLLLISIIISLICITIDLMINKYHFSIFVVLGFICLFIILKTAFNNKESLFKSILSQLIILSILSILWDYFTGFHYWSITYVIPILCIICSINLAILSIVLKDYLDEEMFYFICIALIGIIPLIFIIIGIPNKIPSFTSLNLNINKLIKQIKFNNIDIIEGILLGIPIIIKINGIIPIKAIQIK